MTRFLASFAALALAAAASALPAHAQMGTSNNPPPQNLFGTSQTSGASSGSTMADRRAKLAAAKRTHRTVHR